MTEVESVYSAVRTESLYKTDMLRLYRVKHTGREKYLKVRVFFESLFKQLVTLLDYFNVTVLCQSFTCSDKCCSTPQQTKSVTV
jgi:hypothetical protein